MFLIGIDVETNRGIAMKRAVHFSLIATLILVTFSCNKEISNNNLTIYSMVGSVSIISERTKRRAAVNDILKKGETVETGDSSIVDILIGTNGLLRIRENSSVNLNTIIDDSSYDTQVDMNKGKVFVTLSKLSKGSFKVKTSTAVASVRGTSFRVVADEKESRLDVLSGKVKINPIVQNAVVEEVETIVENNQTVALDTKSTETMAKEKKPILARELKKEEVQAIREEVRDIRPETIERLDKGTQSQLKGEMSAESHIDESSKRDTIEKSKNDEQKKVAVRQIEEKKRQDQVRLDKERMEKDRLEKEKAEKERLANERREKEKRDRATNIPTL